MEIAVLIFIACGVWFAYHVYQGYTGKDGREIPKDIGPAKRWTFEVTTGDQVAKSKGPERLSWSGDETTALPIKTLSPHQSMCLNDASYGIRIVMVAPSERYTSPTEGFSGHPSKTVNSLIKHGFLLADGKGSYTITDLGLRANAQCNVRW